MTNNKELHKKKILHITRFFGNQLYGGIQETINELIKNSNHSHVVACFLYQNNKN